MKTGERYPEGPGIRVRDKIIDKCGLLAIMVSLLSIRME
jgi:hypothetical protein